MFRSFLTEIVQNIHELHQLGDLPNFAEVEDIVVKDQQETVDNMLQNAVRFHKTCRDMVNKQKVERARAKHQTLPSPVKTRRMSDGSRMVTTPIEQSTDVVCIFCKDGGGKDMRKAHSEPDQGLDKKVKDAAKVVGNTRLLSELAGTDMVAIDAVYHLHCLTRLFRQRDAIERDNSETCDIQLLKARAFADLVNFIEDQRGTGVALSMASLNDMYEKRLSSLGYSSSSHTTRLRENIVRIIPDITEVQKSNGWDLVFNEDLSKVVNDMSKQASSKMITLANAAKIIRAETLAKKQYFTGSFSRSSEEESIPEILKVFLHMLLDGPGIEENPSTPISSKIVSSIGQLIVFKTVYKRKESNDSQGVPRHIRCREKPHALLLAMQIH